MVSLGSARAPLPSRVDIVERALAFDPGYSLGGARITADRGSGYDGNCAACHRPPIGIADPSAPAYCAATSARRIRLHLVLASPPQRYSRLTWLFSSSGDKSSHKEISACLNHISVSLHRNIGVRARRGNYAKANRSSAPSKTKSHTTEIASHQLSRVMNVVRPLIGDR